MKKMILLSMILLASVLCPLCAPAANRPIAQTWDINNGAKRVMELSLFQADGAALTLTSLDGASAFALSTNDTVVWQITGWSDYTNLYASTTGTVVSATNGTTLYTFGPSSMNLPAGTYRGFIKAQTASGTNITTRAVLAYQRIKMEYSPNSGNYSIVIPAPGNYYTKDEIDAIVSGVEGRVASVEARTNVWNNAAVTATNNEYRITNIESRTNNWNTAYGWGDHAQAGYLTSAPPQTVTSVNGSTGAVVITAASIGAATGTPLYVQNFDYGAITNPPSLFTPTSLPVDYGTDYSNLTSAVAGKLSLTNITQTVTGETNTVPANSAVSNAFMFKSGNTTNIILGLTNSADSVTMTYSGGVLIFKEIYNGVTNTYNSLNN